ncbi:hypothetical protein QBC44DRAFT_84892 [Cladorrhinum sp. PSN332]|nr:hypothetical protein QBC44DRAFT_84892 [Cladorrhinum sp. PSN332]
MEREVRPSAPMPEGYRFVRKGDVFITKNCRKQTHEANKPLYVVVDQKGKTLGLRCPAFVQKKVSQQDRETATERAAAVQKRDTAAEDRFKEVLLRLFLKIPKGVMPVIVNHALKKHSRRVGRTETIGIEDKVWLAVHAHIRHLNTNYDQLLKRGMPQKDARNQVWPKINAVATQWGRQHDLLPSKSNKPTKRQQNKSSASKISNPPTKKTAQKPVKLPGSSRLIPLRTKNPSTTAAALVRPLPNKMQKTTALKPIIPTQSASARVQKKKKKKTSTPTIGAMRATSSSSLRTRSVTRSQTGNSPKPINKRPASTEVIIISSDDEGDFPSGVDDRNDDLSDVEDYDYDTDGFIVDDEGEDALMESLSGAESIIHSDNEDDSEDDSWSSPVPKRKRSG